MIHIIDPRAQDPLRDLTVWVTRRGGRAHFRRVGVPRYVHDRNLFAAHLVAIRQPTGLYRVIKYRGGLPRTHVRRATLQRYIDRILRDA